MKNFTNCCFVVEGNSDVSKLSNLLNTNFIITNGSEISEDTLKAIKKVSETKEIVIFTDPDYPGKMIRDKVAQVIPNAKHAFVRKEFSISKNKVGVAEATVDEIYRAVENLIQFNEEKGTFSLKILAEPQYLCCNSQNFRDFASNKLGFDKCNNKRFIKRLNQLNISLEEFDKIVQEYKNGQH